MADESAIVWRDGIQGRCMRRPSFQFYPGDWLGSTNLRRCTHAEKGIWLDVMCLMHDAQEYGVLRWPLKEIAGAVGCKPNDLKALLNKGVLKGDDQHLAEPFIYTPRSGRKDGDPVTLIHAQPGPLWYSSRMVRDEYVRKHRGTGSQFCSDGESDGEAPNEASKDVPMPPPKAAPMPPFGDGSSSSSSSSASQEGEQPQDKPAPAPKAKRQKLPELHLAAWIDQEKQANRKLFGDYKPLWDYANANHIPKDWIELAWIEFRRRYVEDANSNAKRYADWRQTFLNHLRNGYAPKLWTFSRQNGEPVLTDAGIAAQRELEAQEVAA